MINNKDLIENYKKASETVPRFIYENYLKDLTYKESLAEMKKFVLDMMDWTQQSDSANIYIKLYELLEKIND